LEIDFHNCINIINGENGSKFYLFLLKIIKPKAVNLQSSLDYNFV